MSNGISTLRPALLRLMKEVAYIGVASIFVVVLYRTIAPHFIASNDMSRMNGVKSALANHPVMFPGKHLSVNKPNMGVQPYTFFLFTSPDCAFCVNSALFHKRLLSEAASRSVPFFVAVPVADKPPEYLASTGIAPSKLLGWLDFNMRVVGTPSLVLVDSQGTVRKVWTGQVASAAQGEVLDAVRDPSRVGLPVRRLESGDPMLKPAELRRMGSMKPVTIISIAERGSFKTEHAAEAVNIPFEELAARAAIDLKRSHLNVVDCTVEPDSRCSLALRMLTDQGFQTAALDRSSGRID